MFDQVVWLSAAEGDLIEIYSRAIEERGDCSGPDVLVEEIHDALQSLRRFPLMARRIIGGIRRLLIGKRRYGLYYEPQRERILVHGVLGLQMDPREIIRRFEQ